MPHLSFRGVTVEAVAAISSRLVEELAGLCECPPDHLMLEVLHTTAVSEGAVAPSFPFVEVAWFDRGESVRDRFAAALDRHLRSIGILEAEVAFRSYDPSEYYANGERLGPPERNDELEKLREDNRQLKEQLVAARKALAGRAESAMSSRLRDALRE